MKDIVGYEGLYAVTEDGKVWSYRKNRWMKIDYSTGYGTVGLAKDKQYKAHYVHRLVAQAFIPNPLNYPIVNHKNEDKTKNEVDNLEWCNHSYNNSYGTANQHRSETMKTFFSTDEGKAACSKGGKTGWTPERRAKQAERMLRIRTDNRRR